MHCIEFVLNKRYCFIIHPFIVSAMLLHISAYDNALDKCLSIRLSVRPTGYGIVCKRLSISFVKILSPVDSPNIVCELTVLSNSDGVTPNGATNEVMKFEHLVSCSLRSTKQ